MALVLPRLDRVIAIVSENFTPTLSFHQWWQRVVEILEQNFNDLSQAVLDIQAAQTAANTAQAAANTAQAAANTAQAAATSAQTSANTAITNTDTLNAVNSGVDVNPLSATDAGTDATISIAAHNRIFPDGTSVAVNAGSITAQPYGTLLYVYYDDPTGAGGAVTYVSTISATTAAQTATRYLVGSVTTPVAAAGDTVGNYKLYGGLVLG